MSFKTNRKHSYYERNGSYSKMMPSIFSVCHPIPNITELEQVLQEPPDWIYKVQPIVPRSGRVVKNNVDDCHSGIDEFVVKKRVDSRTVPKVLVCHDYKGGYQADRYLHNSDEDIVGQGYTFYNWSQIDIFVYFSHHFITIPPLCWINAGHKNGVKVLGTLITEFDSGHDMCDKKLFRDIESMRTFAESLAQVTKLFGFDGWLLNIENKVTNVQALKEFVPYLNKLIHEDNPGNLVIWYDSVTDTGDLRWQNELNSKNRYFFDNCDGIFLNYTWSEKTLEKTAMAAKYRKSDVFVGVDVFGRNMFGGGKFNTDKAVEVAHRLNLSVAIFAPGWTHETLPVTGTFFESFFNRDLAFWRSLWPYMYTHPITTYFTTNFYIGLDEDCYNLFSQGIQLSKCLYPSNLSSIPEHLTSSFPYKCSCIQGSLLGTKNTCLLTKSNLRKDESYIHHLFSTDIEIRGNTVVFFLTKSVDDALGVIDVSLLVSTYSGSVKKIVLLGQEKEHLVDNKSLCEINRSTFPDIIMNIRDKFYKKIVDERWNLSVYIFTTELSNILEIGATILHGNSVLLGAFGVENADGNFLKNL
ncbi:unnamed protein product [Phyllotreta striolata]|uniref:Cytosolic endo-beta-N-acetylglucosaminidase TIM barrel domain-containing protein n=1 Tax=Phyllotreta striolata TaxID=444603 RepID=A0A9N9TLR2_PHYSR|nr:unnamed protein product [Phyllotreta striolata]